MSHVSASCVPSDTEPAFSTLGAQPAVSRDQLRLTFCAWLNLLRPYEGVCNSVPPTSAQANSVEISRERARRVLHSCLKLS